MWSDVESIVEFLVQSETHIAEAHAVESARLCHIIYKRQELKEFPLVSLTDFQSEDEPEAADYKIEHSDRGITFGLFIASLQKGSTLEASAAQLLFIRYVSILLLCTVSICNFVPCTGIVCFPFRFAAIL